MGRRVRVVVCALVIAAWVVVASGLAVTADAGGPGVAMWTAGAGGL